MIDDFDTMHLGGDGGGRRGRAFSRHDDRDDVNFYRAKQQHENHLARRARDEQEDIMRQQERMRLRDELTSPRNPFMRNTLRSRFTFGGDPAFDY
ncbi:hypothetical protein M406DRAFT_100833 [Cryphonectria parasitica EP155]|uniref:Uncharacterized protein n=1 Tax=Cryphonectria parasitica (strain ATCC 38755 / EP155) TaxID=660469 RepID=A0A9P5CUV0_CRYP1|nr:uncharacterized protein M406DRAFT_100833 [Cryphonectria parasitica EP155]KAF3770330.1 hypothetical protein M406DRAFT_100833 [Cryphonectria parasitica EP155]